MLSGAFAATTITVPSSAVVGNLIQVNIDCDEGLLARCSADAYLEGVLIWSQDSIPANGSTEYNLLFIEKGDYVFNVYKRSSGVLRDTSILDMIDANLLVIRVDDLNLSILSVQSQTDDLNNYVLGLETQVDDLADLISDLNAQINDLNSQDSNFAAQFAEINSLLVDQNDQLVELQLEIADINSNLNSYVASFTQRLGDLNSLIQFVDQNLTAEIAALQTQIDDVEISVTDVNTQLNLKIATLQSEVDSLDSRLTSAESTLVEMNHGTINITFREDTRVLRVYGEAPIGATTADLKIRELDNNLVYSVSQVLFVSGANKNVYDFSVDVSTFDLESYNVLVSFAMGGGYGVSTVFTNLELEDITNRVTIIEVDVNVIEFDINALKEQDANFASQLEIIYAHLAVHDQNIIDLANDIDELNDRVDDLNAWVIAQVARLDQRINDVNADLQVLRNQVNRMNHGTAYLTFDRDYQNGWLRVKGEASETATTVQVYVWNADRQVYVLPGTLIGTVNAKNEFTVDFNNVDNWGFGEILLGLYLN